MERKMCSGADDRSRLTAIKTPAASPAIIATPHGEMQGEGVKRRRQVAAAGNGKG
jgi:hypothetical protein